MQEWINTSSIDDFSHRLKKLIAEADSGADFSEAIQCVELSSEFFQKQEKIKTSALRRKLYHIENINHDKLDNDPEYLRTMINYLAKSADLDSLNLSLELCAAEGIDEEQVIFNFTFRF